MFLEDLGELCSGNPGAGITDIYAHGVGGSDLFDTAVLRRDWRHAAAGSALPEEWVAPDFDGPVPRRELARIIQQIDERLLHLRFREEQTRRLLDFYAGGNPLV